MTRALNGAQTTREALREFSGEDEPGVCSAASIVEVRPVPSATLHGREGDRMNRFIATPTRSTLSLRGARRRFIVNPA